MKPVDSLAMLKGSHQEKAMQLPSYSVAIITKDWVWKWCSGWKYIPFSFIPFRQHVSCCQYARLASSQSAGDLIWHLSCYMEIELSMCHKNTIQRVFVGVLLVLKKMTIEYFKFFFYLVKHIDIPLSISWIFS